MINAFEVEINRLYNLLSKFNVTSSASIDEVHRSVALRADMYRVLERVYGGGCIESFTLGGFTYCCPEDMITIHPSILTN